MYFVISMLAGFFLSPVVWILICVVSALAAKTPAGKRLALQIALLVLLIFSNTFLLNAFARYWDVRPVALENGRTYSAAIVLGGFTSKDYRGRGFFNEHSDRLIEAVRLYESGKVSHIMVSGGSNKLDPDGFTEAGYVSQVLKELHLPDSVILVDTKSRNTSENALYTQQVLSDAGAKPPFLLVTSAFHMRRALYLFRHYGFQVLPYPCDYLGGNAKTGWTDFLPNPKPLLDWSVYLKEVFGLLFAHIKR